jgi:glutamate decarboxylase
VRKLQLESDEVVRPTYAGRWVSHTVPKYRLPSVGMSAEAAFQLVHDELNLDGNPALNLASFVSSWMEPQANLLAAQQIGKNMIDQDEYPQTQVIHDRVVAIMAQLLHAKAEEDPTGTATIGSSEAIMLAMLAHKRAWRLRREADGKSTDRPNMVMGADVHTVWEKFCNYFEVEARVAPLTEDRFTIGAEQVRPLIDERTIGVAGLLGTTFTGQMDDLASIDALLVELEAKEGWRIPMHVDAASGGFITPFARPQEAWDFRLPSVHSINVSNHKFGLVYPGMGTVVFRSRSDLPKELIYHINYLGGDQPNYSLNFSRPSTSVILQYYAFVRLGHEGYAAIVSAMLENARALSARMKKVDCLEVITDGSLFPIVVARSRDPDELDLEVVSRVLRERGWIVPAYTLPANAEHVQVLRIVVKENFSRDMVDLLAHDLTAAVKITRAGIGSVPIPRRTAPPG